MDQPSLDDAYAAVDRAHAKIASIWNAVKEFRESQPNAISGKTEPEAGTYVVTTEANPVPKRIVHLVGEALTSDLRPALDYLIYNLAWLDSGHTQKGTQFPICDAPKDFKAGRGVWLKGINDTHVAAIERLQPYAGVQDFAVLRDLCNATKHRHLVAFAIDHKATLELIEKVERAGGFPEPAADAETRFRAQFAAGEALRELPERDAESLLTLMVPAGRAAEHADVRVYLGLTFLITFRDRATGNVPPTMSGFETRVREALDQFQPDFER